MSKKNRLLALKISWSRGGWYQCPNLPSGWGVLGIKTPADKKVFISLPKEQQAPADVPQTWYVVPDISPGSTSKPGMSPSAAISQGNCRSLLMLSKVTANSTISSRGGYVVIQQQGREKRFDEIYQANKILRRSQQQQ